MPIELKMPALSPTMEEGTLAKWLVKEGDKVSSGDLLAEIETDKATMEFEAIDEGVIAKLLVPEGTEGVKVGEVIAVIAEEGEDVSAAPAPKKEEKAEVAKVEDKPAPAKAEKAEAPAAQSETPASGAAGHEGDRIKASPLARRIAEARGVELSAVQGTGPNGRIVKADVEAASPSAKGAPAQAEAAPAAATAPAAQAPVGAIEGIPSETVKLSSMRRTIARRLTESKQQVPHFYLTIDCNLDALLKLRTELNAGLASRNVKLSVNDLLIKALGVALEQVPDANVSYAGENLIKYQRADVSMAVAIPGGLITPVITDAGGKALSKIATEAKDLAARARDGKLQPQEYQGGTASISNLGMFGIKQFDAVINPPQGMILAVGAGEKRPYVVNGALAIATVMTATGSFDHRAIDGAVGAELMAAFKTLIENPLAMVA